MIRVSPQKLNLVAQLIRGKKVATALADLQFSRKRIAGDVQEVPGIGDRQRREQPRPRRRRSRRRRGACRQGARDEALHAARPWPRRADLEAVLAPDDRRSSGRGEPKRREERSMGQKINPIGLRLGINRTWDSRWFAGKSEYGKLLHEDIEDPRGRCMKELKQAAVVQDRHRASAQEVPRHHSLGASGRGDRQEGRRHREAAQEGCRA